MQVIVVSGKGGSRKDPVQLPANATVDDLKRAYRPKVDGNRKSFKIPAPAGTPAPKPSADGKPPRPQTISLDSSKPLSEQGVKDGMEVQYKDLGPQVGYRTVFFVEYAGPLAFMLLYASRPSFIYGAGSYPEYGYVQKLYIALFIAHFVKRELESAFVHKFSHATMPLRNIFKNSVYYWSFGAFIGYVLCSPNYTESNHTQATVAAVAMVINELLNLAVHIQLSRMRKGDGDSTRNVPTGPLFALVTSPNYFFEVMSWVSFSAGTNILSAWLFTLAGFAQMLPWAQKKYRGYCKTDPSVRKTRKAIIPFVV